MSLSKFGNVSKNFRDVSEILRRTRIQVLLGFSDLIKDSCFHFSSTISIWGILHRSYCFLCSVIINIVHWGGRCLLPYTIFGSLDYLSVVRNYVVHSQISHLQNQNHHFSIHNLGLLWSSEGFYWIFLLNGHNNYATCVTHRNKKYSFLSPFSMGQFITSFLIATYQIFKLVTAL